MKRLYVLCILVAAVLIALTAYYRAEPDTFYGIADSKEIVISSESAVEIRRIAVTQGQLVPQGDTLLELHNPELERRISQITHDLSELRARKTAHATLSKSEILQLKAEQEVRVSEIRAEIKELEAQYELNRQLISELHSLDRDKPGTAGGADAQNPILIKIESLRKLLVLAQDPSRVYESRLANALSSSGDPLAEQVTRLEDELRILNEDRRRLVIRAQIGGLIGSVNFKAGEKVSPFTPILTLHAVSPSFVRGYIHEDVYSQVKVKQRVRVASSQNPRHQVEGEVVGVGARIVEYPERLRKRADILIWGREIMIRLPPDNHFLLGEKVLISMPKAAGLAGDGRREGVAGSAGKGAKAAPAASVAPDIAGGLEGAAEVSGLEASGLLFLPDLGRFLVISDDTPKKQALVYLMDTAFRIEKPLPIRGLDKLDDMEAISGDGKGAVYVMSSQSLAKGGKPAEHRRLLVKARRKGEDLELEGKLLLFDLLEKISRENPEKDWAAFLQAGLAAGSIDIEGMSVQEGDLYLGFKAPLLDGKAVILRMTGVDALLAGKAPGAETLSLWKTLDLKDARTSTPCGIADLLFLEGDAYLLSTGTPAAGSGSPDEDHAGELWMLRKGGSAVRLRDFGGAKPEGLAYHAASGTFYVAFDNGSKRPSQILKIGATR